MSDANPNELAALMQSLGIDPSALGGGAGIDTSPPVFMGRVAIPPRRSARTREGDPAFTRSTEDDVRPSDDAYLDIYRWDDDRLREFQQNLVTAGILDPRQVRVGVRDSSTVQSWQMLVDEAAAYYMTGQNRTPFDVLDDFVAEPLPSQQEPFTASVPNPDDVEQSLSDYMREHTGSGKIDPASVGRYQAEAVAGQRAQYDAALAGEGGAIVEPRSFAAFADEEARRTNPTGYSAHKYLDKFSVVASMLGGA